MTAAAVDTTTVEKDIERTRAQLAVSLEALGDKVSPKKALARAKSRADDKLEDVRDRVSPMRIAKRTLSTVMDRVSEALPAGSEAEFLDAGRQPPALEAAKDRAAELTDGGRRALEAAKDKVARIHTGNLAGDGQQTTEGSDSMARDIKASVRDKADGLVGAAKSGGGRISDAVGGAGPAVAGLLAFGGAAAVAAVVAPSEKERRAAKKVKAAAEPLREEAVDAGRGMVDGVSTSAKQRMAGLAKEHAAEAVEKIGRTAKEANTRVSTRTKQAAERVEADAGRAASGVKTAATRAAKPVKPAATKAAAKAKAKVGANAG